VTFRIKDNKLATYTVYNAGELVNAINAVNTTKNDNTKHYIYLKGNANNYVLDFTWKPRAELFGKSAFPIIRRNVVIDGGTLASDGKPQNYNGFPIARTSNEQFRFFIVVRDSSGLYAKLHLRNLVLIQGDSGTQGGGAILNNAPLKIERCTIQGCRGSRGGAIYCGDYWKLRVFSSIFKNNEALNDGMGGAIYISWGADFKIETTTFKNNKAVKGSAMGGAIWVWVNTASPLQVNYCSFVGNEALTNSVIHLNGFESPWTKINAKCNWWESNTNLPVNTANVDNSQPLSYSTEIREMLYPVFGEQRGSYSKKDVIPAMVGVRGVGGDHIRLDLAPLKAYTPCTTNIDPNWDLAYAQTPGSLISVYALTDGTLYLFKPLRDNQPACPNEPSMICSAELRPSSGQYQYTNDRRQMFVYSHFRPIDYAPDRYVKAGEHIGYILNHASDNNSQDLTHLDIAWRRYKVANSPSSGWEYLNPYTMMISGLMDQNSNSERIKCRSLCPSPNCCASGQPLTDVDDFDSL
jgi:hypothetical protein